MERIRFLVVFKERAVPITRRRIDLVRGKWERPKPCQYQRDEKTLGQKEQPQGAEVVHPQLRVLNPYDVSTRLPVMG